MLCFPCIPGAYDYHWVVHFEEQKVWCEQAGIGGNFNVWDENKYDEMIHHIYSRTQVVEGETRNSYVEDSHFEFICRLN